MFAFEFAVLTVLTLSTTARYGLSLYEAAVINHQIAQGRVRLQQNSGGSQEEEEVEEESSINMEIDTAGWEEKGLWIFYLDIATDFFKLVLYLTFFCVLCMFYGMPIHIIRDLALTIRSFYKRIRDFVQYKHATRDMNERYPDATAEEIGREDVCIICRESMTVWQDFTGRPGAETTRAEHQPINERHRAKRLPCGHLLHFACLRSWLERQQICPTCRTPVLTANTEPLNPNQEAGAADHVGPRARDPPPGGPRIYTLGPFRLVLGARHDNNNPLLNPEMAGTASNSSGPVLDRNPVTLDTGGVSIQARLDQIEQCIAQEISNCNLLSNQLQTIRALQWELTRLRSSRSLSNTLASAQNQPIRTTPQFSTQHIVQAFRQMPLDAQHQDLPPGLTLPENWTLHVLERVPVSADSGLRSLGSLDVSNQQAQSTSIHPQNVALDPDSQSVRGSAQAQASASHSISAERQGLDSSALDQNPRSEQMNPKRDCASDSPIGLPDWGSADAHAKGGHEQTMTEGNMAEGSQSKGKAKAKTATVEEDLDDN
ncbi:MAG: hypothetical protein LQ341_005290 [Variospora aurantia]|nr:MAG: hypothetical protein LQ341_005290 [Variospora aurantia]